MSRRRRSPSLDRAAVRPAAGAASGTGVLLNDSTSLFDVWLAFGATVHRLLRTERASRRFNVVMGALLAGSIVLFIR